MIKEYWQYVVEADNYKALYENEKNEHNRTKLEMASLGMLRADLIQRLNKNLDNQWKKDQKIDRLSNENMESYEIINELNKKIEHLEEGNKKLTEQVGVMADASNKKDLRIRRMIDEITEYDQRLSELANEKKILQDTNSSLWNNNLYLDAWNVATVESRARIQAEYDTLTETHTELKKALKTLSE